jgi:hypothetical protein
VSYALLVEQVTAVTLAERQAALVIASMREKPDDQPIPNVQEELARLDAALMEPIAPQAIAGEVDSALRKALNLERW